MGKLKLIHCADIHLDTVFSNLPADKAAIRRDELRTNFSNIISICIEYEADVLLISGDLFDHTKVTEETIAFLTHSFERIPSVKIFIAPGNHDPYMPGSKYYDCIWPENVYIFKERSINKVIVEDLCLNVYGAAFTVPYIERNLLDGFICEESSFINIMLMHGEVVSYGKASPYNPIAVSSLAKSNLDYVALGHVHSYTSPQTVGRTYYAYSGNPEGRGFDEPGEKGVIKIEIEKSEGSKEIFFMYEFVPCSIRSYNLVAVDLSGCSTHEEAYSRISDCLPNKNDFYRVTLQGTLSNEFLLDLRILASRFKDKFFEITFRDTTTLDVDLEALSRESMLRGIFARRMMAKIEDAKRRGNTKDERLYTNALTMGLKAFEGEVPIYDYQID